MDSKPFGLVAVKLTDIPVTQRISAARLVARQGTEDAELLAAA